jgi:hypothetical protein|tara:strand:- start:36 stop:410 length:375 start_codon:yes stop_codon:yes gene_type:complete
VLLVPLDQFLEQILVETPLVLIGYVEVVVDVVLLIQLAILVHICLDMVELVFLAVQQSLPVMLVVEEVDLDQIQEIINQNYVEFLVMLTLEVVAVLLVEMKVVMEFMVVLVDLVLSSLHIQPDK